MTTNTIQNFSLWQRICLWCAGINPDVLAKCPGDILKYTTLGGAMLLIAILGGISASIFLMLSFNVSFILAIPGGCFWGFLILSLDRLLLTTVQKGKSGRVSIILRIVLSISLSLFISEPLMMKLFQGEIEAKLSADLRNVVTIEVDKKKEELTPQITALNDQNKKLSEQTESLRQAVTTAENAYIAEAEGTAGTHKKGKGPVFKEKSIAFERAKAAYETAKVENDSKIQANNSKIEDFNKQIATIEEEVREKQGLASGALARHKALYTIVMSDMGAALIYLPLFFALLCLDTLAISTKLFMGETPYERRLRTENQKSFDDSDNESSSAGFSAVKVREAEESMLNRIFEAIRNGTIDTIKTIGEKTLAEKLQAWMIFNQRERIPVIKRVKKPVDFNEPIIVRVENLKNFKISYQVSEDVAQNLKVSEFYEDLVDLKKMVESKLNQKIVFDGAMTSSGEKIFDDEPLYIQLEDDRNLILKFSPLSSNFNGNDNFAFGI